jgi:hypothetical protein
MWLRRLVAIVMILVCIGLNILTVLGIVLPDKTSQQVAVINSSAKSGSAVATASAVAAPTVSLTSQPSTITAGASSGLTWSTTNSPSGCTAGGSWNGDKTAFGSESTGRISASGNYTYTLTCTNDGGKAEASTTVTVGNAVAPAQTHSSSSVPSATATAATYCGGRLPCYGPRDIAGHASSGNCWGWNGDRVINISGFDAAYHEVKSGISSIQIGQICGHDLGPSLNGDVSAEGKSHVHNQTSKTNADANEIPYFTGYFDASKP